MKCKLKALFIGISISFLIGNIVPNVFLTPEVGLPNFDTWAETAYIYQDFLELKKDNHLEYSFSSHANLAYSIRHSSQNKRVQPSSSSRNGLFALKGKEYKDYYHPLLYPESIKGFSSRLAKVKLYLISLGRLII